MEETQIVLNWDSESESETDWKDEVAASSGEQTGDSAKTREESAAALSLDHVIPTALLVATAPEPVLETQHIVDNERVAQISHSSVPEVGERKAARMRAKPEPEEATGLEGLEDNVGTAPCTDTFNIPATVNNGPARTAAALRTSNSIDSSSSISASDNANTPVGVSTQDQNPSVLSKQQNRKGQSAGLLRTIFLKALYSVLARNVPEKASAVHYDLVAFQDRFRRGETGNQTLLVACREILERHLGTVHVAILEEANRATLLHVHQLNAKREEIVPRILLAIREVAPHALQVVQRDVEALNTHEFYKYRTVLARHLNQQQMTAVSQYMIRQAPACSRGGDYSSEVSDGPPHKRLCRPVTQEQHVIGAVPVLDNTAVYTAQQLFEQQQQRNLFGSSIFYATRSTCTDTHTSTGGFTSRCTSTSTPVTI